MHLALVVGLVQLSCGRAEHWRRAIDVGKRHAAGSGDAGTVRAERHRVRRALVIGAVQLLSDVRIEHRRAAADGSIAAVLHGGVVEMRHSESRVSAVLTVAWPSGNGADFIDVSWRT